MTLVQWPHHFHKGLVCIRVKHLKLLSQKTIAQDVLQDLSSLIYFAYCLQHILAGEKIIILLFSLAAMFRQEIDFLFLPLTIPSTLRISTQCLIPWRIQFWCYNPREFILCKQVVLRRLSADGKHKLCSLSPSNCCGSLRAGQVLHFSKSQSHARGRTWHLLSVRRKFFFRIKNSFVTTDRNSDD